MNNPDRLCQNDAQEWHELLHQTRVARSMTESQAADRCGVSRHVYASWERGDDYPRGQQVQKIYSSMLPMRAYGSLLARDRARKEGPSLRMAGPIVHIVGQPDDAREEVEQKDPKEEPPQEEISTKSDEMSPINHKDRKGHIELSRQQLGERMRGWRLHEGMTGVEVSRLLGIDNSYLMKAEKGVVPLSAKRLAALLVLFPKILECAPPGGTRALESRKKPHVTLVKAHKEAIDGQALLCILKADPMPTKEDQDWAETMNKGPCAAERRWARRVARRARLLEKACTVKKLL